MSDPILKLLTPDEMVKYYEAKHDEIWKRHQRNVDQGLKYLEALYIERNSRKCGWFWKIWRL